MSIGQTVTQSAILSCVQCGGLRVFDLIQEQVNELASRGQVQQICPACEAVTFWGNSSSDRRRSPRVRVSLPIRVRVRCEDAGMEFTEVDFTNNASPDGACFVTRHPLREGTEVYVVWPYNDSEAGPEVSARVICCNLTSSGFNVGVEFLG